MDAIGDAIGEAIASFFGDPLVGLAVRLIAAYVILIWLAAALWALVDMRRRTSSLVWAYGSAAMVILAALPNASESLHSTWPACRTRWSRPS